MIRYSITAAALRKRLSAEDAAFLQDAEGWTRRLINEGAFIKDIGDWRRVVNGYITLQFSKCAYCERKLAGPKHGKIEHDLEHFRPKSSVKAWPNATVTRTRGIKYDFETGTASDNGYFWLAFHPENYATACKRCNSKLKSNYFPVAGQRGSVPTEPRKLKSEKPFLIYPVGTVDTNPEKLIGFNANVPTPVARSGFDRRRAQVTIDFFDLTDESLMLERARCICDWYAAAIAVENTTPGPDRDDLIMHMRLMEDARSPHTSCVRNYKSVFEADRATAERYFREMVRYRRERNA